MVEPLEPLGLVGPDETAEQEPALLRGRIDRLEIDAAPPDDLDRTREQARRHRSLFLTRELERAPSTSPQEPFA